MFSAYKALLLHLGVESLKLNKHVQHQTWPGFIGLDRT